MRVLIVTKIFPNAADPLSSPFNRQQFAALGKLCEVEVLATIPWYPGARLLSRWSAAGRMAAVPMSDYIDGLSVKHPRTLFVPRYGHAISAALYAASLLPYVPAYRGKVDVVLGSWAYPDGVAAIGLAGLLGVPSVVKLHGSDINVVSKMAGPRRNLKWALPRANRVVAVSRALADEVVSLGVARERVALVTNGVDQTLFHPRDKWAAREALGLTPDGRRIVYVGRLERTKGVIDLLEAFAQIAPRQPDLSLTLIGDGTARAECEALVSRIGPQASLAGARPLPEVPLWMGAADLLTLPSWNEGTPNVILEGLACGRPVVASRVGGIPDLITAPALGELVPVKDVVALAGALERVAGSVYDAENIAKQGARGGWAESASKLHRVLEEAIATA
jgi:teichuronic acid biosynthesis glycosyltransferase TuaC